MKGKLGYKIRTITCVSCGKTATGHHRPNQRYCSLACYRGGSRPTRKTGRTVPCALCGAGVYLPTNRLGTARRYFCNAAHANEWQGRNKTSHACKTCGKTFRWSPSRHKAHAITYCSLACRDADPERREQLIAMNATLQLGKPTRLELAGYALLDRIGAAYVRQHVVGGKFTVDAFLPESRVVVQFDGDYWHGNPDCYETPDKRQQKRMNFDRSQDAYMRKCGYRIVRVWESTLRKDPESVERLIRQTVSNSAP